MRPHWVVAAVLLLAGCSADVTGVEVRDAAIRFVTATPDLSCRLLAPDTLERVEHDHGECESVLAGLPRAADPHVLAVEVAGESAQVRLADQVLFLARFPSGWLVTAAGCQRNDPDSAVPYECEVRP